MVNITRRVVQVIPVVGVQVVGLVGLAALVEGVRQVYPPAAFIIGGTLAVVWAVLKSRDIK